MISHGRVSCRVTVDPHHHQMVHLPITTTNLSLATTTTTLALQASCRGSPACRGSKPESTVPSTKTSAATRWPCSLAHNGRTSTTAAKVCPCIGQTDIVILPPTALDKLSMSFEITNHSTSQHFLSHVI
jgi:hypothetical protein